MRNYQLLAALQAFRHLIQTFLPPIQAVVHLLLVLPHVSWAIPSGSSLATILAPPCPTPLTSAATTGGSLEVAPSASAAAAQVNPLLREIDSNSPRLCTQDGGRPNRRPILQLPCCS
jgi:hypothetical protein